MAVEGVGLPFQEAIDFLGRKVNLPTERSDDLRHGAHVRGFSVAGVTRDDMLADFRAAMDKAIAQGTGFKEFRKDFDAIVERYGWKFYAKGDTEEKRRAWRAAVIYRTNMRTAHMAGRYQQMTQPAVLSYRPFWMYRHSDAKNPRPHHVALDGKVFRADDPIWKVIFPPNGWGCNCDVEALHARQMRALGKDGPDEKPDWLKPYEATDPRTGEIEQRWPGIDRGWEYNVGEASQNGPVPVALQAPLPPAGGPSASVPPPPMPAPREVPPDRLLEEGRGEEAYVDDFLAEFGASRDRPQLWRDPSGGVVTIDARLFDAAGEAPAPLAGLERFSLLLAQAIMDPDEIWVDWAEGPAGFVLRRSYLLNVTLPDGQLLALRFEWSSRGWIAVPTIGADPAAIEELRKGALLFQRTQA